MMLAMRRGDAEGAACVDSNVEHSNKAHVLFEQWTQNSKTGSYIRTPSICPRSFNENGKGKCFPTENEAKGALVHNAVRRWLLCRQLAHASR